MKNILWISLKCWWPWRPLDPASHKQSSTIFAWESEFLFFTAHFDAHLCKIWSLVWPQAKLNCGPPEMEGDPGPAGEPAICRTIFGLESDSFLRFQPFCPERGWPLLNAFIICYGKTLCLCLNGRRAINPLPPCGVPIWVENIKVCGEGKLGCTDELFVALDLFREVMKQMKTKVSDVLHGRTFV